MKKFAAVFFAVVMMMTTTSSVFAWLAGDKTQSVDLSDPEIIVSGEYKNAVLSISGGGRAVYQLYVPFTAVTVDFGYTLKEETANMNFIIDSTEYKMELSGSSHSLTLTPKLKMGEHQIIIKTDKAIDISSVVFNKENVYSEWKIANYETQPALTEYEKAIATAVILSPKSSVIMVNGGKRYVDNDNPRLTPYIENSDIYLPLHSFARAFGLYLEEKENEFVLMKQNYTFHYKDGVLTRQYFSDTPEAIANIAKKIDGKFYMPLRYVAELEGKTLLQRGDMYVVDYPSNAKTILKDVYYNELVNNYNNWNLETKKGNTYYVSTDCVACDDNDGSYENPFKTIAKACEVAKAGDTVILRGGIYHEQIAPKNNGTASNPIVFKAAEGEEVLLSACAELGKPVGEENGMLIYTALTDLGDGRNQIFYQSDNLVAARHPNENTSKNEIPLPEDLSDLWPIQGNIQLDPNDKMIALSDTDLDQPEGYWNGATIVSLAGEAYSLGTAKVEKSEPGKLYLTDPCQRWWRGRVYGGNNEHMHLSDYAYLTDHKNAIDKPGEWAYDDGKIYIMPPEGETAETLLLEQKVRQVVIDLSENKFVRIEGINTYGGGMKLNNSEMCMLRDGEYRYVSHYSHSMDQRDGFIEDCDPTNSNGAPPRGEMGIYLGGRDNIVINNHIDTSAAAGIYSVGMYEYIENNVMNDCGYMGSYVGGLFIATEGWKEPDTPRGGNAIFHNSVYNVGRHAYGVNTHEPWYVGHTQDDALKEQMNILPALMPDEVAYNDFHTGSVTARDTGTFYLYGCIMGTDELRSRHHNNLIYDSWGMEGPMNCGLYYDGFSNQIDSYENIVFSTDERISFKQPIYLQNASYAKSQVKTWSNTSLEYVEGGKAGLTANEYPGGKIFRSGADALSESLTPYIDNLNKETDYISVAEGEISDNAVIEAGLFNAQKNGEYICFKDINFDGGKRNQLVMYFTSDACNNGDKISIIVGDNINDYYVKETIEIQDSAPYEWALSTAQVRFVGLPEKSNIYIRVDDLKSFKLSQIRLSSVDDELARAKVGVFADTAEFLAGDARIGQAAAGEIHKYVMNTFGDVVLKFENVKVTEACDEFLIRAGSGDAHVQQPIELRVVDASKDEEFTTVEEFDARNLSLIAKFEVTHTRWEDFTLESVPCVKTIEPGTYNFYIVMRDKTKSTNFFWFGLGQQLNEEETTTEAEAQDASAETQSLTEE